MWSKSKIISIAEKIILKEMNLLEGCRQIVRLVHNLSEEDQNNPDILIITTIESYLDVYPSSKVRDLWNKNVLKEKDKELAEFWQRNESDFIKACQGIIKKFSNNV